VSSDVERFKKALAPVNEMRLAGVGQFLRIREKLDSECLNGSFTNIDNAPRFALIVDLGYFHRLHDVGIVVVKRA
jgi:hypothetical protein